MNVSETKFDLGPGHFQPEYVCNICSKVCLSKAVVVSHMRSYNGKQLQVDFTRVLPQHPTVNLCQFCDKVCRSAAGLRWHMSMYRVNVNTKDSSFTCYKCGRAFKCVYRLRSYMPLH